MLTVTMFSAIWESCSRTFLGRPTSLIVGALSFPPRQSEAPRCTLAAPLSSVPWPIIFMLAMLAVRCAVTVMSQRTTACAWVSPRWGLLGWTPSLLAGHCSCHRAADAIVGVAVGSFGYGCLGGGTATSLVGAAPPAGQRSCYPTAEASVMEAVGHGGYGCLGGGGCSPLAMVVMTWMAIGACITPS